MSSHLSNQPSMISSYSPISTLEQQYAEGQRILLFVKTNANCCIAGGVETVLKLQKSAAKTNNGMAPTMATTDIRNAEFSDNNYARTDSTHSNASYSSEASDPFGFLHSETTSPSSASMDAPITASSKKKAPHKQFTGFLKKVAKHTTDNIERGIHTMAIKADGGKNPDIIMVGLYDSGQLLSLTEAQPLPTLEHERLQGCTFRVPLVVPPVTPNQTCLEIKLYIQSGAALLGKAAKHYLLGSCMIRMADLQQHVATLTQSSSISSSANEPPAPLATTIPLPLSSHVLVDGQLQLWILKDTKFPPLTGRGWSLTDPHFQAYSDIHNNNNNTSLYHPILNQSYVFASGHVTTERATESTLVLPIATSLARLASDACRRSLQHATSVSQALLQNRHDSAAPLHKAACNLSVGHLCLSEQSPYQASSASIALQWQRPDSIFEVELLVPAFATRIPVHTVPVPFAAAVQTVLHPPVISNPEQVLPSLLATQYQQQQQQQPSIFLGNLVVQLRMSSPKVANGGGGGGGATVGGGGADPFFASSLGTAPSSGGVMGEEVWQAVLPLEQYMQQSQQEPISVPVYHVQTKQPMGTVILTLSVTMPPTDGTAQLQQARNISSSAGGLVSLVGLDTLLENNGAGPALDFEATPTSTINDPNVLKRQQQLSTMGNFITHAYLQQHVQSFRAKDTANLEERYGRYRTAISYNPQATPVPSHADKSPKPFRPSSSRSEALLSGIPFNVHLHTIVVEQITQPQQGALFHNVTCGAPADHARGFGSVVSSSNSNTTAATSPSGGVVVVSPVGNVSGGLRRLELKRLELARAVEEAQSALIASVAKYFGAARANNQAVHHIPARHIETATLRWKVFEATQALHHVTWVCALRRASVFSQALGIATTCYLACVSDLAKVSAGWPDLWVRHGFLITYEGLLSAAGKELGMIEDAAVAISMLSMVQVVLVSEDVAGGAGEGSQQQQRVAVPSSPFLKWVELTASGVGSQTEFVLKVCVDSLYYAQRIPERLKDGTAVRFYPLLFQVGVDIRQWGANTMKNQLSTTGSSAAVITEPETVAAGGLLDDEDDDVGPEDNDELVALNFEALRKMNAYAHLISPLSASTAPSADGSTDGGANAAGMQIHPSLTTLHEHILASVNRMNHSILDDAASACQMLGGGSAVFCKSGKDRTAMHVTYKSAQFVHRVLQKIGAGPPIVQPSTVLEDANTMRTYGTRLPICEKNVGQAKYAFNSLQVKFMPDALKPPPKTLAGFLKGGKVFQGGGIES